MLKNKIDNKINLLRMLTKVTIDYFNKILMNISSIRKAENTFIVVID